MSSRNSLTTKQNQVADNSKTAESENSPGSQRLSSKGNFNEAYKSFSVLRRFSVYALEIMEEKQNRNQVFNAFVRAMFANDDFRHLFYSDAHCDLVLLAQTLKDANNNQCDFNSVHSCPGKIEYRSNAYKVLKEQYNIIKASARGDDQIANPRTSTAADAFGIELQK